MTKIDRRGTPAYEENIRKNVGHIRTHTLSVYEKLWSTNMRANLDSIESGGNILDLLEKDPAKRPTHALMIANGPSVVNYKQLEEVAESEAYKSGKLTVVACDAALKKCLNVGIIPNYITCIDGTEKTAEFFKDLPTDCYANSINVFPVASIAIHPSVRKLIEGNFTRGIRWFVPVWDDWTDPDKPSITRFVGYIAKKAFLDTIGNVGAFSYYFCGFLGARHMGLMGLDYGYPAGTDIEEDQYYKAYLDLVKQQNEQYEIAKKEMTQRNPEWEGQGRITIKDCYRLIRNPDTGKDILVGLNWDAYRVEFLNSLTAMYSMLTQKKIPFPRIENRSPESSLFHPQMKTRSLTEFLTEAAQ